MAKTERTWKRGICRSLHCLEAYLPETKPTCQKRITLTFLIPSLCCYYCVLLCSFNAVDHNQPSHSSHKSCNTQIMIILKKIKPSLYSFNTFSDVTSERCPTPQLCVRANTSRLQRWRVVGNVLEI